VAPGLVGLLTRHAALGALVVAGVGLIALAAGVLLMRERSSGQKSEFGADEPEATPTPIIYEIAPLP